MGVPSIHGAFISDWLAQLTPCRAHSFAWVQRSEPSLRECPSGTDPQLDLSNNDGLFAAAA
jgi:hypothetical protein